MMKNRILTILFVFLFFNLAFSNSTFSQACSGSWVRNHPLTFECISGQLIGHTNTFGNPVGCPTNPTYLVTQTNTFNFTSPFNQFYIDFNGFGTSPDCAKIEIKINGAFFPLTTSNLLELPSNGTLCTGDFQTLKITNDG